MAQHDEQPSLGAPVLLLVAATLGFVLSNSPLAGFYYQLIETPIRLSAGDWQILNKPLLLLINDGLMAIFFLFIGLELKRELLVGELSDTRKAMLPIAAAIGGMVVPALIYLGINPTGPESKGWGVPMATDIAFALGLLAVLGSRIPASLKVMLAAIAIVDDLGAILVIALFYTSQIDWSALIWAFVFFGLCCTANRLGLMKVSAYLLMGLPFWYFMLKSGVHATIAGVLLACAIPMAGRDQSRGRLISDIFAKAASPLDSPAVFLEKSLIKWIGFLIIPLFALCNSGVSLSSIQLGGISAGIILGLAVGKPLGIAGASYLATRFGWAQLPPNVDWRQVIGIGFLAGIGFTMSLFISSLAFDAEALNNESKLGILIASLIAGSIGILLLLAGKPESPRSSAK